MFVVVGISLHFNSNSITSREPQRNQYINLQMSFAGDHERRTRVACMVKECRQTPKISVNQCQNDEGVLNDDLLDDRD